MSKNNFQELRNQYGLEGDNHILVDNIGQCPLVLTNKNGLTTIKMKLTDVLYNAIEPDFKNVIKSIGFRNHIYRNNILTLVIMKKANAVEMYGELKRFIEIRLSNQSVEILCEYCGKTECDTFILKNDALMNTFIH